MPLSKTKIELPAPSLVVACDTCGETLQVFLEDNTSSHGSVPSDENPGVDWILSACRCGACDHRRDVESYRRGWDDAKKYYPDLIKKGVLK
jgi:hypothetical protein